MTTMVNNIINKIPCIKCDDKSREYIQSYLTNWGYYSTYIGGRFEERFPILMLNWNKDIKCYGFGNELLMNENFELINNIEEFLEKAAEIQGIKYERNDKDKFIINGILIKPGMTLTIDDVEYGDRYIVFPIKHNDIAFANIDSGGWRESVPENIVQIRDLVDTGSIDTAEILWTKSVKKTKISIDEIAEVFGIPKEQIEIEY